MPTGSVGRDEPAADAGECDKFDRRRWRSMLQKLNRKLLLDIKSSQTALPNTTIQKSGISVMAAAKCHFIMLIVICIWPFGNVFAQYRLGIGGLGKPVAVTQPQPGAYFEKIHIRAKGEVLHLWGLSGSDIWAAGLDGLIMHWNGREFRKIQSSVREHIQRIWGRNASDVWFVGNTETAHWDGRAINLVPSAKGYFLLDIWGDQKETAWAVGRDAALLRLTNGYFVRQPVPVDKNLDFLAIWGSADDNIWAVGEEGTIINWNGRQWAVIPTQIRSDLNGIWGSGYNDIWIVGVDGVILHWDGRRLSEINSGTHDDFLSIWGTDERNIWFTASQGSIVHWDGEHLIPVRRNLAEHIGPVWGSGEGDVWLPAAKGTIYRYRGKQEYRRMATSLTSSPLPCRPGETRWFNGIVAACTHSGDAWGVIGSCESRDGKVCDDSCKPASTRCARNGAVQCDASGRTWNLLPRPERMVRVNTDAHGNAQIAGIKVPTSLWDCVLGYSIGCPGHHFIDPSMIDQCPMKSEIEDWKKHYQHASSKK